MDSCGDHLCDCLVPLCFIHRPGQRKTPEPILVVGCFAVAAHLLVTGHLPRYLIRCVGLSHLPGRAGPARSALSAGRFLSHPGPLQSFPGHSNRPISARTWLQAWYRRELFRPDLDRNDPQPAAEGLPRFCLAEVRSRLVSPLNRTTFVPDQQLHG